MGFGAPIHAAHFTHTCKAEGYEFVSLGVNLSGVNWREYYAIWNLGLFGDIDSLLEYIRSQGLLIINHWIGTDILIANNIVQGRPRLRRFIDDMIDLNCYDNLSFGGEVNKGCARFKGLNLHASWVPTIPFQPMHVEPFPETEGKIVAVYCPVDRADFFGLPMLFEAAKELPYHSFHVLSHNPQHIAKSPLLNIYFKGRLEPRDYRGCHAFLNLAPHGGLGITAIEFAQMGRQVLIREPAPYATRVGDDVQSCVSALEHIRDEPDEKQAQHYQRIYSPEMQKRMAERALSHID